MIEDQCRFNTQLGIYEPLATLPQLGSSPLSQANSRFRSLYRLDQPAWGAITLPHTMPWSNVLVMLEVGAACMLARLWIVPNQRWNE